LKRGGEKLFALRVTMSIRNEQRGRGGRGPREHSRRKDPSRGEGEKSLL